MSFYKKARDGALKVSLVLTVPRTVSSALARALERSTDVDSMFYQAFDKEIHGGGSLRYIEKKLKELEENHKNKNRQPHIVFKEMAFDISKQRLRHLGECCSNIVILCRDPHHQTYSTVKALYKLDDKKKPSISKMRFLRSRWDDVYYKGGWEDLMNKTAYLQSKNAKITIIDGDLVRYAPGIYLKRLCGEMGIGYSNKMIDEWLPINASEKASFNTYRHGYTQRIMQTSSLIPPKTAPPALSDFPRSLRMQVVDELRYYSRLMSDERAVRPSLKEAFALAHNAGENGKSFAQVCPVTLYSLNSGVREFLRKSQSRYQEAFDIIDKEASVLS